MSLTALRRILVSLMLVFAASAGGSELAAASVKFSALAVDARTGEILFASDADGLRHPASLTKMMTLYVLFQEMKAGHLTLDSRLSVSRYAAGRPPTKLGVGAGQTVRVEDAIKALITLSANDMAVAVGENIAGSEAAFAQRMTQTARSLGMSRTTFRNASGLPDPKQVTTARDMATLGLRIQRDFPQYYPYFSMTSFQFGTRTIRSHNRLLGRFEGTDGIKTGYIRASGYNLTTSARRGDKRIIGVVMGGRTGRARDNYMITMLTKAFPQCVGGATLANAIEGTRPRPTETEKKVAEADEPDSEAIAKRVKTRRIGKAPDQSAVPQGGDIGGFDNEEMAEQAETAAKPPGTTFAAVDADQADIARVSGEVANPDDEPEVSKPADLPFKVKKPGTASDGKAIIASADATWNIQLGAYPTKKAAQSALYAVRKASPKLFANKQAFTVEVKKGEETMFRACKALTRKGVDCAALAPQS
jgi:D-alanyl-D-alanine carboxypeptidase